MHSISPGFIDLDALSDLDTTILGIDHHPGWAKGRVWPRSYVEAGPYEMYSQEELAFQKRFAFGQLLLNGITTAAPIASLFYREWGETVAEFDAAAEAAGELGLRVYLSPAYRAGGMVLDAPGQMSPLFDEAHGLKGLREAVDYIGTADRPLQRSGRGHAGPGSRRDLHGGAAAAGPRPPRANSAAKSALHMAQGAMEVETVRKLHGSTAPVWLAKQGLLNDRLIAPHATNATEEDLELYAANGVSIVHCPLVSARGGSTLNSFSRCRERGINIAMGTDTAPADMMMNLLVGLIACRINDRAPDRVRCADLFDAATLGGAKALGRDDLGKLAPGARADIAVFGLDDAVMAPSIDPITTLVTGGSGKVTQRRLRRRTPVDAFRRGRRHRHDGRTAARADSSSTASSQNIPSGAGAIRPVSEIFPPSYPIEVNANG